MKAAAMGSEFYLSTAGESDTIAEPRKCNVLSRLRDARRDDYVLVEIDKPVSIKNYRLGYRFRGRKSVSQLILASRGVGSTLCPVNEWPCSVYVCNILDDKVISTGFIKERQVGVLAWGWVFPNLDDAMKLFKKGILSPWPPIIAGDN